MKQLVILILVDYNRNVLLYMVGVSMDMRRHLRCTQ